MLLITLAITVAIILVTTIVRRIWFHPLSHVPGPWIAKFTDLLDFYSVIKGARTFRHHEMLQRYGSPVRTGTNHLTYADLQSWTDIYAISSTPCMKDPNVYSGFSVLGNDNILSATDRNVHSRLRRLLAHSFSARGLAPSEPLVASKIQQLVECTMQGKTEEPVDMYAPIHELFLDIVSWLSFGKSFDCLGDDTATARADVAVYFSIVPLVAFIPILKKLPIPAIQNRLMGLNRLITFSSDHVDAYLDKASLEKEDSGTSTSFLENLAKAFDSETGTRLTRDDLVEHSILFLAAGSGTTSVTLIFLLWECGRSEVYRKLLTDEIRRAFPEKESMPDYESASRLPYLKQVISETLRLYGPLNASGPRVSPGKMMNGQWIPKGTIVETCTYTTARNPTVFHDPLTFTPSRWENPTPEMKRMSRPFSYGPRNCIGQHLAEMALTLTVARLYQLFDVIPTAEMTTEYMQQEDRGVLEPRNEHFYVRASPVDGAA